VRQPLLQRSLAHETEAMLEELKAATSSMHRSNIEHDLLCVC